MEKACSRFLGKVFFSLDALWSNDPVLFCILFSLVLLLFLFFIMLRKRGDSRVISFFGFFLLPLVLYGNASVAHAMGDPGEAGPSGSAAPNPDQAGPSGSAAGNQAGTSTPSSSFFRGLSGELPVRVVEPGEEVLQPGHEPKVHLNQLPVVPQEELLGAIPHPLGNDPQPRPLVAEDLAKMQAYFDHTLPALEEVICSLAKDTHIKTLGGFKVDRLINRLETLYGIENMAAVLEDMKEKKRNSPYWKESFNYLEDLRKNGVTEKVLRREWNGKGKPT